MILTEIDRQDLIGYVNDLKNSPSAALEIANYMMEILDPPKRVIKKLTPETEEEFLQMINYNLSMLDIKDD